MMAMINDHKQQLAAVEQADLEPATPEKELQSQESESPSAPLPTPKTPIVMVVESTVQDDHENVTVEYMKDKKKPAEAPKVAEIENEVCGSPDIDFEPQVDGYQI